MNELAKHVYLSGSYFANLFKKVTGTTLIHYMTGLKIDKAKEMLLNDKQVQEVAIALGYEDRSYFTDVFKKHTGLTPSEFKQAYRP
ncbi:HTH-type transcriptional regulator YesS [compost metagenome]